MNEYGNSQRSNEIAWLPVIATFAIVNHSFVLTLINMGNTRKTYDADFKLKAITLAVEEGNRSAARNLGINESMVRRWRRQQEELSQCKKTTKAFRGTKANGPSLKTFWRTGLTHKEQAAAVFPLYKSD